MKYLSKAIKREKYNIRFLVDTEAKTINVFIIKPNSKEHKTIKSVKYSNFDEDKEQIKNSINETIKSAEDIIITKISSIEFDELYIDLVGKINANITADETIETEKDINLQNIVNKTTDNKIKRKTKPSKELAEDFLNDKYLSEIDKIVNEQSNEKQKYYTLTIDYELLSENEDYSRLRDEFKANPVDTINNFNEAVSKVRQDNKKDEIVIKVAFDNTEDELKINEINSSQIGKFIKTKGIIKQIQQQKAILKTAYFRCNSCSRLIPIEQNIENGLIKPAICSDRSCNGKIFRYEKKDNIYGDFQKITIQEDYSETNGANAKEIEIYMYDTIIDNARLGSKVEVAGVLSTVSTDKQEMLSDYYIKGNLIKNLEDEVNIEITKEDEAKIKEIAGKDNCIEIITNSFNKSLILNPKIKLGIICALVSKTKEDKTAKKNKNRFKINILFITDPSMGKTDLKKYCETLSTKYVSTSGMGSSSVGLTATVSQDKNNRWILQAGAYPLAGDGIVFIDEFDKLSTDEQSELDTVLSDNYVKISKAGINTTISTPANTIAFANPKYKRFNRYKSIMEQININPDVLSRFDLIFRLEDIVDEEKDTKIATSIIDKYSDKELDKDTDTELLSDEFLKKYLIYIKNHYEKEPIIEDKDTETKEYLINQYNKLRNLNEDKDVISFDTRRLQAIIRLSTAIAKLRLNDTVTLEDTKEAIDLIEYQLVNFGIVKETGEIDIDKAYGKSKGNVREQRDILLNIIKKEATSLDKTVETKEIIEIFTEKTGCSVSTTYDRLGELKKDGYIKKLTKRIKLIK